MEYPFKDLLPLDEVLEREGYYKDWTHLDPEVFYSLTQISEYIKTKGYGVDVRLLIAQLAEHFGLRVTQITDAMNEFSVLKPKAELSISRSMEAITKSQNALNVANGIDAKATNALNISQSADTLSKSVQEQFNQVVISGDSSVEAAQARVDKNGKVYDTLKDRIDSVTINPTLNYAEELKIEKGSELVDLSSATLGSGWTREGSGFRHSTGSSPLTIPIAALSSTKQYEIIITVTNPASGPGGQSDFWLRLGGTAEFETYSGGGTTYKYVMYAGNANSNLIIRPWEDYQGVITVSVKEIVGGQLPYAISIHDNQDKVLTEIRTGEFGSNSLYLGYNSGRWAPDAKRNTAVGDIAMSRMTTGFWNTATGYGTLQENTVGTRNVALGYIALRNNISGDRNIGIGSFALTNLKTGRNNVAIGVDTYYHATQGDGNIAIGLLALATNPHSDFNIAIGNNSMSGSIGGSGNVALGNDTLRNNRGSSNVALGDKALSSNSSGSFNVGVGINSLRYSKTGTYNIGIGENTGMYMEGTQNIAIGRRTASNLGEGTKDNIALGYLTLDKATGGTENIAIGASAMSRNAVDVGTRNVAIGTGALRWADGAEGNVGIGNDALQTTQSGRRNVAIGQKAGDTITTGSDNIIIGSLQRVPVPTGDKQLNIGGAITSDNYETGTIDIKRLKLTSLPTTTPSDTGVVWNDGGTLKIS